MEETSKVDLPTASAKKRTIEEIETQETANSKEPLLKRARQDSESIYELHRFAADKDGYEEVKKEVEKGSDINAKDPISRLSPLALAARTGSFETFKYLIELRDIDLTNSKKNSRLLKHALLNSDPRIMDYLFDDSTSIAKNMDCELPKLVRNDDLSEVQAYEQCFIEEMGMTDLNTKAKTADYAFYNTLFWAYNFNTERVIGFIHHLLRQQIQSQETNKYKLIISLQDMAGELASSNKIDKAIELISFIIELMGLCSANEILDYQLILANLSYNKMLFSLKNEAFDKAFLAAEETLIYSQHIQNEKKDAYKAYLDSYIHKIQLAIHAKKYGFRCKDVKGDGSCFYYAMIEQLKKLDPTNQEITPQQLRDRAARHIRANFEFYQDSIPENERETYLEQSLGSQASADHLFILALSRELNMTFVIINSDGSAPEIIRQANPDAILFFGYEMGRHYQYLSPNNDDDSLIQSEIAQTDIDYIQTKNVGFLDPGRDNLVALIGDFDDFEARRGKAEKLIEEKGCDVTQKDPGLNLSPIEAVLLSDDIEMFSYLFPSIFKIPHSPEVVISLLELAAKEKKQEVLACVSKIVLDEKNDMITRLFYAFVVGNLSKVNELYEHQPELIYQMDKTGRSLLYFAILTGNKEIQTFIESKLQESMGQSNENRTPAFQCMQFCAKLLSKQAFHKDSFEVTEKLISYLKAVISNNSDNIYSLLIEAYISLAILYINKNDLKSAQLMRPDADDYLDKIKDKSLKANYSQLIHDCFGMLAKEIGGQNTSNEESSEETNAEVKQLVTYVQDAYCSFFKPSNQSNSGYSTRITISNNLF